MILNKVKIENYRQYKNTEINFANENDKNFTIIQGNNGTGKTTLLNALSWCLYNSEIHDYGDDASMSICNNKATQLANNGDDLEVKVYIEFLDNNEILAFKRVAGFRKIDGNLIPKPNLDKFEVITESNGNIKINENDYYTIERKIPKEIEDYFFFDGARLSEYFQTNKNMQIKDAVFGLSQLNLFESVKNNLNKVTTKYIAEIKKIEPKIGFAHEEVENLEKNLKMNEESLLESENIVKNIKNEIDDIDNQLLTKKSKTVEEYVERNRKLDSEIRSNNKKLNEIETEHKNHILKNYPYILSNKYFDNFLNLGEKYRDSGVLHPPYIRKFILDLLNEGKCICGNDISYDNEFRQELERILEKTSPLTDDADLIRDALKNIEDIKDNNKKFKKESFRIYKDGKEIQERLEELIKEKRNISSILDANPHEEIRKLKHMKDALEKEKTKHERNIIKCENEIKRIKKELGEKRKSLNKELSLKKEVEHLRKKIKFCKEKSAIAERLYLNLKKDMQLKIQKLTKNKFIKIQWKEDEFIDVRINDNYEVFVKNRLGYEERPGDLSDGEKLCLGLCFMSALHNISGFDLPIIMDTPLGNLDVDMRRNIAKFLPQFVGDKQTVLLVTGTEYTDDFRDILYNSIGKEYKIEWNSSEEGKESKVVLV